MHIYKLVLNTNDNGNDNEKEEQQQNKYNQQIQIATKGQEQSIENNYIYDEELLHDDNEVDIELKKNQ